MWKKIVAVLVILLLLLLAIFTWVLSAAGLQKTVNYFLEPDYRISLSQRVRINWESINLPQLAWYSKECQLAELQQATLTWQVRKLFLQQLQLDAGCFQQWWEQSSTAESSPSLTLQRLFALLPLGEIEISELHWINTDAITNPRLQQFLAATTTISAVHESPDELRASLRSVDPNSLHEKLLLNMDIVLNRQDLAATAVYQPDHKQYGHIQMSTTLAETLDQLPLTANVDFDWHLPHFMIPQGRIKFYWQDKQARLQLYDIVDGQQHQRLNLPFNIQHGNLKITQAAFNWEKGLPQPLQGFLNVDVHPKQQNQAFWNSFPLNINFRLSLLSHGEKGKGIIIIQGVEGLVDQQQLNIPLQINGNIKSFGSIFYARLPLKLSGTLYNPTLHFLSGSLLRMNGNTKYVDIHELRLPLAGVEIGQHGVKGRLQAILKGKTHQLDNIELHLDGRANDFITGIYSMFNVHTSQNTSSLQQAHATADIWHWNFWGKANIPRLHNLVQLRGHGFWQDHLINIALLKGELDHIVLDGVVIAPLKLHLLKKIQWDYQQQRLNGELTINTPSIQFDYGGQFLKPDIQLSIDGKDFTNFNLRGELTSDKLGPIRLFSSYREGGLRGNIYWPQQSAKVFQMLFPQPWEWLIQDGSIHGQTAFSMTPENGLTAGGHVVIQHGNIRLPKGSIKGMNFSLPYHYQHQRFQFGRKTPVEVNIDELDNGIQLRHISVKLQGHYPWHRQQPLSLTHLHVDLLGGELEVDKFSLPQHTPAFLRLNQIELSKVLALLQYNQLEMVGKVNADLPFWIENSPCIICDGVIKQGSAWRIHLSDALIKKIEQSGGMTERILTNLLGTMDIYDSNIKVNLLADGSGLMNARIKANNVLHNPIFLNYNHKENVFDLWRSINFATELQQNLEYRLYQYPEKKPRNKKNREK